jgi:sugar phosphate isomerase/epimerase
MYHGSKCLILDEPTASLAARQATGVLSHVRAAADAGQAVTTTCFLGLDPWVALECLQSARIHYVELPAYPARQTVEWRQTTFSPETLGPNGTQRLRERLAEMDLTPITVGAYASVLEPDDFQPLLTRIDFAQQLGASFVIIDAAGDEPQGAADTSGGRGDWAFGPLGKGPVDLPKIVDTLKSHGFRGPYSLEVEGYAGEDLTRETRVERVRQSLHYLSRLGIQPWPSAS